MPSPWVRERFGLAELAAESANCARPNEIKRKVASHGNYTTMAGGPLWFRIRQAEPCAMPRLPRPDSPDRDARLISNLCGHRAQELDWLYMQQRTCSIFWSQALPRRIA